MVKLQELIAAQQEQQQEVLLATMKRAIDESVKEGVVAGANPAVQNSEGVLINVIKRLWKDHMEPNISGTLQEQLTRLVGGLPHVGGPAEGGGEPRPEPAISLAYTIGTELPGREFKLAGWHLNDAFRLWVKGDTKVMPYRQLNTGNLKRPWGGLERSAEYPRKLFDDWKGFRRLMRSLELAAVKVAEEVGKAPGEPAFRDWSVAELKQLMQLVEEKIKVEGAPRAGTGRQFTRRHKDLVWRTWCKNLKNEWKKCNHHRAAHARWDLLEWGKAETERFLGSS